MPNLFEQQSRFISAIFSPAEEAHDLLSATQGSNVSAGLAIYRNNVFSNYRRVLSSVYPVIQRLVGDDFFATVSDSYIHAIASQSGDVRLYGAAFADFLSTYPAAMDLVYLPDVARIEWACHQVLHEPVSAQFTLKQLAAIPAEQLSQSQIKLSAASSLVSSMYPAIKIWQVNQPDYVGDDHIDLNSGADYGVMMRQQFLVTLHPLNEAEFKFLTQLRYGNTLAAALQSAQNFAAEFDLGGCLMRHIGNGVISQINY